MYRRGPARPLVGHEVKPSGDLRTVLRLPLEVEHLMIAESARLVHALSTHPRRDVAFANPIEWNNGFWLRPAHTSKQRKDLYRLRRDAEKSIARVAPFAAKGDLKAFFPSATPRRWISEMGKATGIPSTELCRHLMRLRDLAVEVESILGYVGLPVGPELSDVVGNALLHPLDDVLVAQFGTAGYARYVDDFAFATEGWFEGMSALGGVESDFLAPLGLRLNWDKCDVVLADALRLVGDTYTFGDDPDAVAYPATTAAFRYSRAQARGIIKAATANGGDEAIRRLVQLSPRLLAAGHDLCTALRKYAHPFPAELTAELMTALSARLDRVSSLSTTGDFLLEMFKSGLELNRASKRPLINLALRPEVNHNTAAAASWILADGMGTLDHRVLARVDEMVPFAARAIAGSAVRAGQTCDWQLRSRAQLTA